jgi:phosphorylcholine metabolism protein LicD
MQLFGVIAKRNNWDWMLWAGSHLGAVLHGGVIPWDDDVDVIVCHDLLKVLLNTYSKEAIRFIVKFRF